MESILFLILIVMVSGLIAYVGDWIGRKMGRKRLTLFGLRPRHTAVVISVSVGVFIAAITLTITLTISKQIRDAFFTPLESLRSELSSKSHELAQKEDVLRNTDQELAKTRANANEATAHLAHETQLLTQANDRLQHAVQQRQLIQRQLGKAEDDLSSVDKRLQDNRKQLADVREKLQQVNAGLTASENRLTMRTRDLLRLDQDRLSLEDSLGVYYRSSFAPLAFTSGQEIISDLSSTTDSNMHRKMQLLRFFTMAEKVVRQQCTALPPQSDAIMFWGGTAERPVRLKPGEAAELLAARIAAMAPVDQVIVRLSPVNNVTIDSPAILMLDRIELIPNQRVFPAGGEVARIEIDPKASTADILGSLVDKLVLDRVPTALRQAGMVNITRRYSSDRPDETPAASRSLVRWSDLFSAADQVRAIPGKAYVIARSRTAVNRYGPLDLTFDVVSAATRP